MALLGFTLPPDSGEKLTLGKYSVAANLSTRNYLKLCDNFNVAIIHDDTFRLQMCR